MSFVNNLSRLIEELSTLNKAAGDSSHNVTGRGGKSQHPTATIDDRLSKAPEGAQSRANEAVIRDTVSHSPASAAAPDKSNPTGAPQIGTKNSPTGKDPAAEDNYKDRKYDPGTSLPADVHQMGEKYSFHDLRRMTADIQNDLLADLIAVTPAPEKAASAAAATAGYQAAAQTIDTRELYHRHAVDVLSAVKMAGYGYADLVGQYLYKVAEEEAAPAEEAEEAPPEEEESAAEGELPPEAAAELGAAAEPGSADEGGASPEDLDAMLQVLQQIVPPEQLMQLLQQAEAESNAPAMAELGAAPEKIASAALKRANLDRRVPPVMRDDLRNNLTDVIMHVKAGRARVRPLTPGTKAATNAAKYREYIEYILENLNAR